MSLGLLLSTWCYTLLLLELHEMTRRLTKTAARFNNILHCSVYLLVCYAQVCRLWKSFFLAWSTNVELCHDSSFSLGPQL
jgi:hypothetical protein